MTHGMQLADALVARVLELEAEVSRLKEHSVTLAETARVVERQQNAALIAQMRDALIEAYPVIPRGYRLDRVRNAISAANKRMAQDELIGVER